MVLEPEKWLSNLWIIEKNSGICIFEQSYMEVNMNSDLISGFLVAMLNFGKELANKDLQSIQFNDLKISFKEQEKYIIAIAITDNANSRDVESFMELIIKEFAEKYEDKLDNFHGQVDVFNDFGIFVENLVNKKALGMILLKSKVITAIEESEAHYQTFLKQNLRPLHQYIEETRNIISKILGEKGRLLKTKEENFDELVEKWKLGSLKKTYLHLVKQYIEYNKQLKDQKD